MLKGLLNPEKQLKKFLKGRLPHLKNDLCRIIEDLLLNVADKQEANPFLLALILSEREGKAIGRIFDENKNCLAELDAGEIMVDLFKRQLEAWPTTISNYIEQHLENENVGQMVVDSLKGKAVLIHYGKNEELVFIEVSRSNKKTLDLDHFLNNLEF